MDEKPSDRSYFIADNVISPSYNFFLGVCKDRNLTVSEFLAAFYALECIVTMQLIDKNVITKTELDGLRNEAYKVSITPTNQAWN